MYQIHMITDDEKIIGDIKLVEEIIECYTDSPSWFIDGCIELEVGKSKRYSNHLEDFVIVTKIS